MGDFLFTEGKGTEMNLWERGTVQGTGRSGERENCSQDAMYETRINEKNESVYNFVTTNTFSRDAAQW